MWHEFVYYFGIPNGAIWGNVLAEPIIVALSTVVIYLFRNALMKRFVAFHHRHKSEHEARLAQQKKDQDE